MIQHNLTHHHDHEHNENISYLYKTLIKTNQSADYLFEKANLHTNMHKFPSTKFAHNLQQVAQFILAGSDTQIYLSSSVVLIRISTNKPVKENC